MKKSLKKLSLSKETLRTLSHEQESAVVGGNGEEVAGSGTLFCSGFGCITVYVCASFPATVCAIGPIMPGGIGGPGGTLTA